MVGPSSWLQRAVVLVGWPHRAGLTPLHQLAWLLPASEKAAQAAACCVCVSVRVRQGCSVTLARGRFVCLFWEQHVTPYGVLQKSLVVGGQGLFVGFMLIVQHTCHLAACHMYP